jgi:hypothetical protein
MKKREQIEKRINKLARNGKVTAAMVVADAKKPDSPLHSEFDWDVKSAAEKHWLETGRLLIRSVQVNIKINEKEVRSVGYVRDPEAEPNSPGYVSIARLRTDEDVAHEAVSYEFIRAAAAVARARKIAKVLDVDPQMEEIEDKIREFALQMDTAHEENRVN